MLTRSRLIRPLQEEDLPRADHIMRLAFGTFLGLPEPTSFMGDAGYVATRWASHPENAIAAQVDDELIGSNFVTAWGAVGFFGPLTVHPDHWDGGIASKMMERTMELLAERGVRHSGLFTFGHSPKHVGLYQKFGFWPRFLTAVAAKPVVTGSDLPEYSRFSQLAPNARTACLSAARELTDSIFDGLDLEAEINAVDRQSLGDTLFVLNGSRLSGLAVCHCGPGTEAGSGSCYVKFAAVRLGPTAGADFASLLDACEAFASAQGVSRIIAGANFGRSEDAWRQMVARGYRADMQGVTMHRPNEPGYNRPDVYIIDDWR